jgi:hypothetical protein
VRADDPRHGKLAGYRAGCHEQCCRKAANDHTQRLKLRGEYGKRHVDATGTRRRVQALAAIGWSHANVSRYIGWEGTFLAQAMRTRGKVHVDTAAAVRKAYDDLSMKLPPQTTTSERMSVARTLKLAERQGWLPPLAYDDGRIDDPDSCSACCPANGSTRPPPNAPKWSGGGSRRGGPSGSCARSPAGGWGATPSARRWPRCGIFGRICVRMVTQIKTARSGAPTP